MNNETILHTINNLVTGMGAGPDCLFSFRENKDIQAFFFENTLTTNFPITATLAQDEDCKWNAMLMAPAPNTFGEQQPMLESLARQTLQEVLGTSTMFNRRIDSTIDAVPFFTHTIGRLYQTYQKNLKAALEQEADGRHGA